MKRKLKIPRAFKLRPDLEAELRKRSAKTNITQTRIVELALKRFLALKP